MTKTQKPSQRTDDPADYDASEPIIIVSRPIPGTINCSYNEWPETVPVLTADDLWWNYTFGPSRGDLLVWLDIVFESARVRENPKRRVAKRTLETVLAERLGKEKASIWRFLEETWKRRQPSLAWQAAVWNESMRRLGFEVPEDVCEPQESE